MDAKVRLYFLFEKQLLCITPAGSPASYVSSSTRNFLALAVLCGGRVTVASASPGPGEDALRIQSQKRSSRRSFFFLPHKVRAKTVLPCAGRSATWSLGPLSKMC